MSPLFRLVLVPAALSLWSAVAAAKDIPGIPKELIGTFAESPENCEAFFESVKSGAPEEQLVDIFRRNEDGRYTYGDCNMVCFATILSYRNITSGYVVKMRWVSMWPNRIEHLSVTKLDRSNKLIMQFIPGGQTWDVVRCPAGTSGSSELAQ